MRIIAILCAVVWYCGSATVTADPPGTGRLPDQPPVPSNITVHTDVAYGQTEGEAQLCDIYVPQFGGVSHPAIIFIHGGGWVEGNKRQVWPRYLDFAAEGFVVMSIDYRLGKPYPAAVDDCQRAVRWLRANAEQYRVDPARLGATGQSAGGHLASMLGVTDTLHPAGDALDPYSSKVQAVVNQFGPTQISAGEFGYGIPYAYDLCCNCQSAINEEASPLFHVDSTSAPFLLMQGANDPVVNPENMICMARALYKANVEVIMMLWPNTGHGNGDYDPLVWQEALRFFKHHLPSDNSDNSVADFNTDGRVDLYDFAVFAQHWLES